jgi:microcystin-dependent protein
MSGSETTTPFLGLIKPPIGADDDVWGDRLNTNSDTLDANASSHDARIAALEAAVAALQAQTYPQEYIGSIKWWPGLPDQMPAGWLNCAGQAVAVATYPDLFGVIGYYWGGAGGGFLLPDLRGRVLVGMDQGTNITQGQYGGDRIGGIGGAAIITLTNAQMPYHAHGGSTDAQGIHAHNVTIVDFSQRTYGFDGVDIPMGYHTVQTDAQGNHAHNIATDAQGGNQPHSNAQPGALGYWMIKALNS